MQRPAKPCTPVRFRLQPPLSMTVFSNLLFNIISHIVVIASYFLFAPFISSYFGSEGLGLFTLSISLIAMCGIAELGMTQCGVLLHADFQANKVSKKNYSRSLSAIRSIFMFSIFFSSLLGYLGFLYFTKFGLEYMALKEAVVNRSMSFIFILLVLRVSEFYFRMIFAMHENFKFLAIVNSSYSILKIVPGFLICYVYDLGIDYFFLFQVIISALLVINLQISSKRYTKGLKLLFVNFLSSVDYLRPYLNTISFLAIGSILSILGIQSDRLIIASNLSLAEFGYFSMSVLAASILISLSTPISTTFMPRISKLISKNAQKNLLEIFDAFTSLSAIVIGNIAIFLIFFSYEILIGWTGDKLFVENYSDIFRFYVLGNLCFSLSLYVYNVQLASNNLKFHFTFQFVKYLIFVSIMVVLLNKLDAYSAMRYIAITYFLINAIELAFFGFFVFGKFLRDFQYRFFYLIFRGVLPSIILIPSIKLFFPEYSTQYDLIFYLSLFFFSNLFLIALLNTNKFKVIFRQLNQ